MNTKDTFPLRQKNLLWESSVRFRATAALLLCAGMATGNSAHAQASAAVQTGPAAVTITDKCDSSLGAQIATQTKVNSPAVSGWSSVIIRLTDNTLDAAREKSLTDLGSDIYRRLTFIGSVAVRVPNRNLGKLADLPFVAHLSRDGSIKKNDEFTVQTSGSDVAYTQYGLDGSGVGVAVLDSGIHVHPDLRTADSSANRIVVSANFTSLNNASDTCGHGTHVAGIIAGNGFASNKAKCYRTFYGIARNANLINVRVLDGTGQGNVSGAVAGINWVIQNKAAYNIRVLNVSLGHAVNDTYKNDPLCQAAEAAYKAGIVVVCAAGNNGRLNTNNTAGLDNEGWGTAYGTIQSPGNDPYVITVGAMKDGANGRYSDHIATYSSRGPSRYDCVLKPDIVAPGNRVISTNADGSYLDTAFGTTNMLPFSAYITNGSDASSSRYLYLSGTSMASPVVAGAAALLIQQNPAMTPDTVKARLMLSADKWANANGSYDACTYGAGYLNIPAALNSTAVATRSALSPTLSRDNSGNVIVDVNRLIWGGTSAVWGVNGLTSLQTIWSNGAIVNTQVMVGNQKVPSTVVANSQTIYGNQVLWGGAPTDSDPNNPPPPPPPPAVDLTSTTLQGEQ